MRFFWSFWNGKRRSQKIHSTFKIGFDTWQGNGLLIESFLKEGSNSQFVLLWGPLRITLHIGVGFVLYTYSNHMNFHKFYGLSCKWKNLGCLDGDPCFRKECLQMILRMNSKHSKILQFNHIWYQWIPLNAFFLDIFMGCYSFLCCSKLLNH